MNVYTNYVLFAADDGVHGKELWISDGTDNGTKMLKNIASDDAGVTGSQPDFGFYLGTDNLTYFTASTPESGRELWRTDGTEAGTVMVADLNPGSADGIAVGALEQAVSRNGVLLFPASDGEHGIEAWVSSPFGDSTERLLPMPEFNAAGDSNPADFFPFYDGLLVTVSDAQGRYLIRLTNEDMWDWQMEKLIDTAFESIGNFAFFIDGNNVETISFTTESKDGTVDLWRVNEVDPAPVKLMSLPVFEGVPPTDFVYFSSENALLFTAQSESAGRELWLASLNGDEPELFRDFIDGSGSADPELLYGFNGPVFFSAKNADGVMQLWQTDGTVAGTTLLADVNAAGKAAYFAQIELDGGYRFLFPNEDGAHGAALWQTNATSEGTAILKDINPTGGINLGFLLGLDDNHVLFSADDGTNGTELWITDGTSDGTQLLKNINSTGGAFTTSMNRIADILRVVSDVPDPDPDPDPVPVPSPSPAPTPEPVLIDGTHVYRSTVTQDDGSVSQAVNIPIISTARFDTVGGNAYADIPLVATTAGGNLLMVQVPTGLGVAASGFSAPQAAGGALTHLLHEIQTHADDASGQALLSDGGSGFLAKLPSSMPLIVQTIVPTAGEGTGAAPLVIFAPEAGDAVPMTAVVLDAAGLPANTEIQLNNISFAAIIGAARITGGAGAQQAWGDSAAQVMVLGADNDVLHGGAGNDTVGSAGGNDWLYGDAGDDMLFGGPGQDVLIGGEGADVAKYDLPRNQYGIERNGGIVTVRSLADPADADVLINIESIVFADAGFPLDVAGAATASSARQIAGLYAAHFGRAPDADGLRYWLDKAEQGEVDLRGMSSGFAAHEKFGERYPESMSSAAFVAKVYESVLGVAGDEAGRAYWTDAIDHGLGRGEFIADLVRAALSFDPAKSTASGADLTNAITATQSLNHKVDIGLHFAAVLDGKSNGGADSSAYQHAIDVLSGVGQSTLSLEEAVVKIDLIGGQTGFGSAVPETYLFG